MIYSVCTVCKEMIRKVNEVDGDLSEDDHHLIVFPCRECFEEMVQKGEEARFDLHGKCNRPGCYAFDPAWRHRRKGCNVIVVEGCV